VFVTSGAASKANAYLGPYAASKAALDTLVRVLGQRDREHELRVNLFSPGPIRTRMRASVFPGEDPMTLDTPEPGGRIYRADVRAGVGRDLANSTTTVLTR
jgi:NAD(P)-dependent dehydrogenase (short-subunit alcohol dehydrogenase family)